jgi:hypothetical protein
MDQLGYNRDANAIVSLIDKFFIYWDSDGTKNYPMHIGEMVSWIKELEITGEEYRSEIMRAMIFLNPRSRSASQRLGVFDILMIHYHNLSFQESDDSQKALGEDKIHNCNPMDSRWQDTLTWLSSAMRVVYYCTYNDGTRPRVKTYADNFFGRLDFTRCLITHCKGLLMVII